MRWNDCFESDEVTTAKRKAREEVAAIFADLESDMLETLNEIRGALGKHALQSLADIADAA